MIRSAGSRLSRSERKKLKNNKKSIIALLLALALLVLVLGKSYWKEFRGIFGSEQESYMNNIAFQAFADSLVVGTIDDFRLDDPYKTVSYVSQIDGPSYRIVSQSWPNRLPTELFIGLLQNACAGKKLSCDCLESAKQQKTTCTISRNGVIGAKVILEFDKSAFLKDRRAAFLIKNAGVWNNESILEIIDKKIPFGYIGTPDTYPTGAIRSAFEKAKTVSILELPGRKSGLAEFKRRRGVVPLRKNDSEKEGLTEIFERHPNLKIIYFNKSLGYDLSFIKESLSLASEMGIAYLYNDTIPDQIDSLAYASGLNIVDAKNIADFNNGLESDSLAGVLYNLIMPDRPNYRILVIDARKNVPQAIIRLNDLLKSLGIKIKSCMELTDTLKSF